MPYGRSNTSEVIPPRGSIGSQDSTAAVAGNFSRTVGVALAFAEYIFLYSLGASTTFTFGVNGDGNIVAANNARLNSQVGDGIRLSFNSSPNSLVIPAGWMWWANVQLAFTAPATYPAGEALEITRMDGTVELQPIVRGGKTAASGYSGSSSGQAVPLYSVTTLQGTLITPTSLTLKMMALQQLSTTPNSAMVSAVG